VNIQRQPVVYVAHKSVIFRNVRLGVAFRPVSRLASPYGSGIRALIGIHVLKDSVERSAEPRKIRTERAGSKLNCIPARQPPQRYGQFNGSRHLRAIYQDWDHGYAALKSRFDLQSYKITGVINTSGSV